jgi:rRNA maturation endonuclease Nob1
MFFFIAGLQPRTIVLDKKQQVCPSCGLHQAVKKRTDYYLSLFFLPIIPVKKGIPYLYCSNCNDHSIPSGIELDHSQSRLKNRCVQCGRPLEPEFILCPYCGKEIQ